MDKQVRGVITTVCSPLSVKYGAIEMNVVITDYYYEGLWKSLQRSDWPVAMLDSFSISWDGSWKMFSIGFDG